MLHPFAGTQPLGSSRRAALLFSIVAHALFVVVLFAPRAKVSRDDGDVAPPKRSPVMERVRYIQVGAPVKPSVPDRPKRAPDRSPSTVPVLQSIPSPEIAPIAIAGPPPPEIDLRSKATDSADFTAVHLADMVKPLVGSSSGAAEHSGPYTKANVDKTVQPFASNPIPEYPWRLRNNGVEGSFVVQFVVDSTGRVVEQSMFFPPEAHSLFVESVRRALRKSRYYAAEVDGRRVDQLVEQRFTFILVRDGRSDRY